MWSYDKSVAFSEQLDASEIDNIQADVENDNTDISCILEKIQNLFENTVNTVLGHEREYQKEIMMVQKKRRMILLPKVKHTKNQLTNL